MLRERMTKEVIDLIPPCDLVVSTWVGSDDVLMVDGEQVIEACHTDGEQPGATLGQALDWWLSEKGGNSIAIAAILNGKLTEISFEGRTFNP